MTTTHAAAEPAEGNIAPLVVADRHDVAQFRISTYGPWRGRPGPGKSGQSPPRRGQRRSEPADVSLWRCQDSGGRRTVTSDSTWCFVPVYQHDAGDRRQGFWFVAV
jgi:hypothetical protein